ncbi:tyrosine kinase receptor Cad96Ca [Copidosoma floridanum]|uniref:tyrosine kinase receptor Cad96Ca n=1 Tax=Copidosoma floridanum TaxID=29053 RepID=UPI0006C96D17|nr:tyrosine kinase receptor Cad96Ca [Copidosoma floridanum]
MLLPTIVALTAATFFLRAADCEFDVKTPPEIHLTRSWILHEDDPVGKLIEHVTAKSYDLNQLTYSLEPSNFKGHARSWPPLPFLIDNTTGDIYLNESLKGRGGQSMTLYVTVSDGGVPAKAEVNVNIQSSAASESEKYRSQILKNNPSIVLREPSLAFRTSVPPSQFFPLLSTPRTPPRTRLKPETSPSSSLTTNMSFNTNGFDDRFADTIHGIENKTFQTNITLIEPSSTDRDLTMILVPVAAVCVLVFCLSVVAWSSRKHICMSKKSKERSKEHGSISISTISNDPFFDLKRWQKVESHGGRYEAWEEKKKHGNRFKRDDKWEFPRHRLKVFNILGEGCFGQVWRCEALDIGAASGPTIVAVKTLKENASERERLDLAQELKVMKCLDPHPNIVRLLGCCTEREPMFVILEYVSGGKLQSFLRASREARNQGRPGLTSRDLTSFVYQVAKGMEYLASKGIIHRDLAARNVLIEETRVCKVADFGFARDVAANQIYERKSEGRLPIRWMAPESLYDNIFSVKSDIWSFGVLIWEIVTLGSTPYPGLAAAEVMRRIKDGYRLDRPEHCKRELYNIMYYCWDKDPACRPSFTELVSLAEGLLLDETDYIELDRFPDHSYYNVLNLSGEKL